MPIDRPAPPIGPMTPDYETSASGGASRQTPPADVSATLIMQIAEQAPALMLIATAPAFRIAWANAAARAAARDLVGQVAHDALGFVEAGRLVMAAQAPVQAHAVPDRTGTTTTWWDVSYAALTPPAAQPGCVLITAVDVTHHQATLAQARAAQDTLDALLSYIPDGISIAHGDAVHVDRISAHGLALVGRDAAELTGHNALEQTDVWEVYRPGSDVALAPAERPLARATRTGQVCLDETLIVRRADGNLLHLLCNSGPIRDGEGQVTGAVMAWRDVSALHSAQAAMRDSEERLRAVLLQIPAAIFIVEPPDGTVTFKSGLVDAVLGNPEPDMNKAKATLRGWAVHKNGAPYDLDEFPSRRALYHGETVRAEPMAFWRGDGRLIDLEMHAGPVRNQAGEIVAAVAVALDVTERNLASARLRESEARLRLALLAGGLGPWEVDQASNTHHFGASLAAMAGLPAESIVVDSAAGTALIHPDDRQRVAAAMQQAFADGHDIVEEFRVIRTDGTLRWFSTHGRIIAGTETSPPRAVGVASDVTERRLREDRLREAVEAREVLLREADHRIKNSLQLVASLLSLQRSRLTDPDAAGALDGAISRVLAISQAHRALHSSADLRHIALDSMLGDLCAHVGMLNPALTFLCACSTGLELDTERAIPLGLVVSELLTNAAKHAYPSGAGEVRTTVSATDGMLEITVADAGVGMTMSGARRSGLGSTIVRTLVAQIGATMEVNSAPGQGTRTLLRFAQKA